MNCVTQTHMPKAKLSTRTEPKPGTPITFDGTKTGTEQKTVISKGTGSGSETGNETKYFILTKR